MPYILSNANRWYCGLENSYGSVPSITSDNRIQAIKMTARQQLQKATRRDKTGSRTFAGTPSGGRRKTDFSLSTYLTTWSNAQTLPGYGPLIYAAMGWPVNLVGDFEGGFLFDGLHNPIPTAGWTRAA